MDWNILFSTFTLLFLAELGDKTQLAVIAQTCRTRRPGAVFLGASLALTVVTGIGVVAGQLVGQLVPDGWIQGLAAAGFIVMGLVMAWQAWRLACPPPEEVCDLEDQEERRAQWRAFGTTFSLLAVAELGDKTQLAVFAQASQADAPWAVLAGASLGLIAVTGLGAVGGQALARLVPELWLRRIAALAFIVMGVLIGLGVL